MIWKAKSCRPGTFLCVTNLQQGKATFSKHTWSSGFFERQILEVAVVTEFLFCLPTNLQSLTIVVIFFALCVQSLSKRRPTVRGEQTDMGGKRLRCEHGATLIGCGSHGSIFSNIDDRDPPSRSGGIDRSLIFSTWRFR